MSLRHYMNDAVVGLCVYLVVQSVLSPFSGTFGVLAAGLKTSLSATGPIKEQVREGNTKLIFSSLCVSTSVDGTGTLASFLFCFWRLF